MRGMSTRGASQPTAPVQGRLSRVLASGLARSVPTSVTREQLRAHTPPLPHRDSSSDSFTTVGNDDDHARTAGRRLSAILPRRESSRDSFSTVGGNNKETNDARALGRRLSASLWERVNTPPTLPRRESSSDSFSSAGGDDEKARLARAAGRRLSLTLQENMELQSMVVELERENALLKLENEALRAADV
mgnify:CR=1 FL=1